jgi:hypothetical protein
MCSKWLIILFILFILLALILYKGYGPLQTLKKEYKLGKSGGAETPVLMLRGGGAPLWPAVHNTLRKQHKSVITCQPTEIDQIVRNKDLSPVVLVAQGAQASTNALEYQKNNPLEVAGLVLVNPSPSGGTQAPGNIITHIAKPTFEQDRVFSNIDRSLDAEDIVDSIRQFTN